MYKDQRNQLNRLSTIDSLFIEKHLYFSNLAEISELKSHSEIYKKRAQEYLDLSLRTSKLYGRILKTKHKKQKPNIMRKFSPVIITLLIIAFILLILSEHGFVASAFFIAIGACFSYLQESPTDKALQPL